MTDTVPAGLTINGTPAGCTVAGQVVTCNVAAGLSNVAPNNTATFTINVTPTAAAGTSVSNTASVTGGGDPSCPVGTPCTSPPVDTALSAPNLTVAKVGVLDNTVVGAHALVRNAIVDKNVAIPPCAQIGVDSEHDRARGFVISEGGVTVVGKGQRVTA